MQNQVTKSETYANLYKRSERLEPKNEYRENIAEIINTVLGSELLEEFDLFKTFKLWGYWVL